jgi:hypothetical protein
MIFKKIRTGTAHLQRGLAVVTLACGFFMMWGSSRGAVQSGSTNAELQRQAIEIDPLLPDGKNNQAVVVAAGRFSSPESLEDELIKPGKFLILKRRVEMYQWKESPPAVGGSEPKYSLDWFEGQVDFFAFKQTTGHENPLLRYQPVTRKVSVSSFGAFDGSGLLQSVRMLTPLELTSENLKDPTLRIEDSKIVIPRSLGISTDATLGDMRVWYEVLPQGDYTVLTRQVDERNLVGADPDHASVMRVGLLGVDGLFAAEAHEVERISTGLLYLGGCLFFIGLYSLLAPMAPQFNLRPKINLEGAPALALVCLAVSAAAVVIFFIVGQIG